MLTILSLRVSKKGYMTGEIGRKWIEHDFDPVTSPVANGRPRLLIVDGHSSHFTRSFLEYAKEKHIVMICLPPHTTHVLQSHVQTFLVVIILTKPDQTLFLNP